MTDDDYISAGAFAERTSLSSKALRVYATSGLLQPASVNPDNGYRRYALEQVEIGRLIALLRALEMSLSDIADLVEAHQKDDGSAVQQLALHMRKLTAEHEGRESLSHHITQILNKEDKTMFTIETRSVPARRGLSIMRRQFGNQTDAFVAEAKAAFRAHLGDKVATGPFTLIFHGRVDAENDGPIEAFLGCPDGIGATDLIGIRTEPAHEEAFTRIKKAQWAFPAILAAYDAVACSPEAVARSGSALSCREVYVAEPDAVGPEDEICDVAFPLK